MSDVAIAVAILIIIVSIIISSMTVIKIMDRAIRSPSCGKVRGKVPDDLL